MGTMLPPSQSSGGRCGGAHCDGAPTVSRGYLRRESPAGTSAEESPLSGGCICPGCPAHPGLKEIPACPGLAVLSDDGTRKRLPPEVAVSPSLEEKQEQGPPPVPQFAALCNMSQEKQMCWCFWRILWPVELRLGQGQVSVQALTQFSPAVL
ncbi:uncharacterized protein ACIB01_017781 isoform 2-T2 [Guaruba guarouba]